MLEVLDESLKKLLVDKMQLNLAEVDISFDVPNRDWSKSISKPTINFYLYDIRENVKLRQSYNPVHEERRRHGEIEKFRAGGRYDISYLITAWTINVEDEHRLLWYVLATLAQYQLVPQEVLLEPLNEQPWPLPTSIAQPDGVLRNAADVWTALDNQLKPVLSFVVTIAMDDRLLSRTKEVRTKFFKYYDPEPAAPQRLAGDPFYKDFDPLKPPAEHLIQIGGRIYDASRPDETIAGAEVILLEQGLNERTDERGRFSFGYVVARPEYTILVVAPGYETTRRTVKLPSDNYDVELQPEKERVGV
jgi:hypothetical protein